MLRTFAPAALTTWTQASWQRRRSRFYFGSCLFWLVIIPLAFVLHVAVYLTGVVVILLAQLVSWVLDLVTLGHFSRMVFGA